MIYLAYTSQSRCHEGMILPGLPLMACSATLHIYTHTHTHIRTTSLSVASAAYRSLIKKKKNAPQDCQSGGGISQLRSPLCK